MRTSTSELPRGSVDRTKRHQQAWPTTPQGILAEANLFPSFLTDEKRVHSHILCDERVAVPCIWGTAYSTISVLARRIGWQFCGQLEVAPDATRLPNVRRTVDEYRPWNRTTARKQDRIALFVPDTQNFVVHSSSYRPLC